MNYILNVNITIGASLARAIFTQKTLKDYFETLLHAIFTQKSPKSYLTPRAICTQGPNELEESAR